MTKLELLDYLEKQAASYRIIARNSLKHNEHMNELSEKDRQKLAKDKRFTGRIIDALLVDFINYIGFMQCVDYKLHTKNLQEIMPCAGKTKLVAYHDDPPCATRLGEDGLCPECKVIPDIQSTALAVYCAKCDLPLVKISGDIRRQCPKCKKKFEHSLYMKYSPHYKP